MGRGRSIILLAFCFGVSNKLDLSDIGLSRPKPGVNKSAYGVTRGAPVGVGVEISVGPRPKNASMGLKRG